MAQPFNINDLVASKKQRSMSDRGDLLKDAENAFYGGGQAPQPTPTPTPKPRKQNATSTR